MRLLLNYYGPSISNSRPLAFVREADGDQSLRSIYSGSVMQYIMKLKCWQPSQMYSIMILQRRHHRNRSFETATFWYTYPYQFDDARHKEIKLEGCNGRSGVDGCQECIIYWRRKGFRGWHYSSRDRNSRIVGVDHLSVLHFIFISVHGEAQGLAKWNGMYLICSNAPRTGNITRC